MSAAAITVAALLVASPSITDADRIAANGGFLLGNAHRCGMGENRVTQAGQLIRTLISAAAPDDKAEEDATARFSAFFLVSTEEQKREARDAGWLGSSCRPLAAVNRSSPTGPRRAAAGLAGRRSIHLNRLAASDTQTVASTVPARSRTSLRVLPV